MIETGGYFFLFYEKQAVFFFFGFHRKNLEIVRNLKDVEVSLRFFIANKKHIFQRIAEKLEAMSTKSVQASRVGFVQCLSRNVIRFVHRLF